MALPYYRADRIRPKYLIKTLFLILRLQSLFAECKVQMKDLLRQQLCLQEEIKVKENTLYIGQLKCYFDKNR